jgi:cytochrome b subunit of formate dehydrogenase
MPACVVAAEGNGRSMNTTTHVAGPARHRAATGLIVWTGALAALLLGSAAQVRAQDPENCLSCHRFRGLSRLEPETNELRLFFCSAEYYVEREGAHARLRCTACHERDEVAVIPHDVQTPVDCTQTCHIAPAATGAALTFSHLRVEDSLRRSAHSLEMLADLEFDPPLLRPGQSTCLYCHDQPTFGFPHGIPEGFRDHSGDTRCDTCHAEELPLEIEYFAAHVAARMKPARPVRQLAQVCAVCHSDPRIVEERYDGHDAVASYLHSFHGKASLLGSKATATCVECHSSQSGDQHLMLAADNPDSSINPAQLPDTCRTVECHPGYPPEMSTAAVHLPLDPAKHTPEFYVAAFFILMTAGVMALFFLLVILELLNAMVRPVDRDHHRMVTLARRLQAHPDGRRLLQRMTVHERVQHWWLAISFTVLVLTGMPIKFAEAEWSHFVVGLLGGLTPVRVLHRIAGVVLLAVFVYHIGYLLVRLVQKRRADRKRGASEPLWKTLWMSPMMVRPEDVTQFVQLFGHLLFMRRERPRFGRYNILEKFEYWAVFWGMPVMGLSGLALWGMPWVTEHVSGRAMNFAFIIHSDEAYLAFIYIAAIHLFSVIFAPTVFPLSRGTLTGQAPLAELVEGHRGELEALARQVGLDPDAAVEAHSQGAWERVREIATGVARRAYSGAAAVLYVVVATTSISFLMHMLLEREAAPVEIVDIPKRLDADAFFTAAVAPASFEAGQARVRGPLAHFHQIPQWFQPDPKDSCATAGCHTPLPHGQRIEVRAFLNMHATFVDCVVCHADQPANTTAEWFRLPERTPTETPAILRLAARLETLGEVPSEQAAAVSAELQALLREALPASGYHRELQRWLLQLETTHPRSRLWRSLVQEIDHGLGLHVRGEYAAKIGLYRDDVRLGIPTADQQAATAEYLRRREQLSEAQAQPLLDRVHVGIAPTGALCTPCHAEAPTLIDMAALGYPQARVEALRESSILRSVLSIESGKPFYLPLESESETK